MLRKLGKVARSHELTWRYLYNLKPTLSYRLDHPPLSAEGRRVLDDLNRDGVAVTSVESLMGDDACYRELASSVARVENQRRAELAAARSSACGGGGGGCEKVYLFQLLGERPRLDTHQDFARFALQEPILGIADAYYGMRTRLRSFNVWRNFARTAPAEASQLWHRDKDDLHYTLKVFLLLSDVDETNGPFVYAKGSHSKGRYCATPAYQHKDGNTERSTDAQMAAVVPADEWLYAEGRRGTLVFADTHGYHKGGHATERDRLVFVSMYSSPLGQRRPGGVEFERGEQIPFNVSKTQAVALAPPGV